MIDSDPARFYLDGSYERLNPTWDTEDSGWKARQVFDMLSRLRMTPSTITEVGCGSGAVLAALRPLLPGARFHGWDIAAGVERFWSQYRDITFTRGDITKTTPARADLMLLLDVVEHVANPHEFLSDLRPHASALLLHIPLDLSAASVLRESPLLNQRRCVGHIHYFTKGLALELLNECGYEIVDVTYTGAYRRQRSSMSGRLASVARRVVFAVNQDAGVRLLGGDTLLVLAKPRSTSL